MASRAVAGLLLVGPILLLALPGSAVGATPLDILSDPDRFDGQSVTIIGTITDLRERGDGSFTFTLADEELSLRVSSFGSPACGTGATATVDGVFQKDKHDGYTIYSEVEATRVTCR